MKNNRLRRAKWFSKKIISFLFVGLIFPVIILAEESNKGILLTGLFADSRSTHEQEILSNLTNSFGVDKVVWTYDQTDIITGTLGALASYKNITTSTNGLEESLLSQISNYRKTVIAHSASTITAVNLAKQGILREDELYVVSPTLISQDNLRQIRDLTAQGKGFNKIVLYTGDDMIPDFKELSINGIFQRV